MIMTHYQRKIEDAHFIQQLVSGAVTNELVKPYSRKTN